MLQLYGVSRHWLVVKRRIAAWRLRRRSVSYAEQCHDLTDLRAADERYSGLNAQSGQVTLKRLDLAFRAFFRRCKNGQTPGFPRFRSFERFSGWGYKTHGDGFRFTAGNGNRYGRLRLSGIGTIPVRGRARTPGEVVTCEVQHKAGRWYASLTLRCRLSRTGGTAATGLDWGVETFATLAYEGGAFAEIANPRFVRAAKAALEYDGLRERNHRTTRAQRRPKGGLESGDSLDRPKRVSRHAPVQSGRGWCGVRRGSVAHRETVAAMLRLLDRPQETPRGAPARLWVRRGPRTR